MIPVCPRCDVALVVMEFKDLEVDFCAQCRGLWMDAGELEALLTRTNASLSDPLMGFISAPAARKAERNLCPRCDRRMVEVVKFCADGGELRLDRCQYGHGLWFDEQELHRLMASFPNEAGAGNALEYLNEMLGKYPTPATSDKGGSK